MRESRFVEEYLLDHNATAAAKRAKYSEKTAYQIAHELLRSPRVKAAVEAAIAERTARTKIDTDWVVLQLRELYAIAVVKKNYTVARSCLEQLGKHTGGFVDRLDIGGALTVDVAGAQERILAKLARLRATKENPPTAP